MMAPATLGPFAHSGALRATLSAIRKKFGIRSCRPPVPGERDYRHCLDHIIKTAPLPASERSPKRTIFAGSMKPVNFSTARPDR